VHKYSKLLAVCAVGLTLVSSATPVSNASQTICRGPRDNLDLARTAIRVAPSQRLRFLNDVNGYAKQNDMGVGSVGDYAEGSIILILQTRPYGIIVRVQSLTDAKEFEANVRTCNAEEDWRPVWKRFKRFMDARRTMWR